MRTRSVLAAVALTVVAACSGEPVQSEPTTPPAPDLTAATTSTTTTTTTEPATASTVPPGEGMTLRFGYEDGQRLEYSFLQSLAQHMTMEAPGLSDEELPGNTDITMTMGGSMTVVATELEDGHQRIEFTMSIEDVSGEMKAGTEVVDLSDPLMVGELSSLPLDYEIVIDDQGRIVDLAMGVGDESMDLTPFLEIFGGDTSGMMGGFGNEALFGVPSFPDGEIAVGTTWEVDLSQEALGLAIEASSTYTVTDIEGSIVTIDVETWTGPLTMTSDLLIDLLTAMAADARSETFGTPLSDADIEQLFGMFQFEVQTEATTGTGTLQFDQAGGITVSSVVDMDQRMHMTMSVPDETGGGLIDVVMDLDQSMTFEMKLEDSGST